MMNEKPQTGIGLDGLTLRETLAESERLFAESGHYWGLDALEFKESDPIEYEKIYARLRAGLVSSREIAKRVAASPIVEQEGECCFVLYTPDGDSIALSTGIIVHVHTMSEAIKYMIRNDYESNPCVRPGDIFCNNDPSIGNVHPCDVATIIPVFIEDELVAWIGGVTHVIDIGAVSPGSMAVGPVERFGDGFYASARKVGANDELFRDWILETQMAVRTPSYWTLDERTRISGCFMARDMLLGVIKDAGLERYKQFARESIEDGRRGFVRSLRTMTVPGRYRGVSFADVALEGLQVPPFAAKDSMMHAPSDVEITADGQLHISFDGANEWGWHSFNCTPAGMQGGIWVMLTQTVIPNEKINDGAYFACKFVFPEGTWTNPGTTQTAHSYAWHFLVSCWSPLWRALSRGYFARGFLEEVNSGNANTSNWLQGGGIDQFGRLHAVNSFESSCEGGGASALRDGIDHAVAVWNPEGDMGDMEVWELNEPLLFLGRQGKPNTAGPGKFRGGSGYESLRMVWGARDWVMYFMGNGYTQTDCGMFGGYPAATGYRLAVHDTDLAERFSLGEMVPTGGDGDPENSEIDGSVKGQLIRDNRATTTPDIYKNYDLYLNYLRGGPGLGDPIERDIRAIEIDLNEGVLLPRYARSIYGAVCSQDRADGRWTVSEKESAAERQTMRDRRLARARPVDEWMADERDRILRQEASAQVREMYQSSMKMSERFAAEFREFWSLADDWKLEET